MAREGAVGTGVLGPSMHGPYGRDAPEAMLLVHPFEHFPYFLTADQQYERGPVSHALVRVIVERLRDSPCSRNVSHQTRTAQNVLVKCRFSLECGTGKGIRPCRRDNEHVHGDNFEQCTYAPSQRFPRIFSQWTRSPLMDFSDLRHV